MFGVLILPVILGSVFAIERFVRKAWQRFVLVLFLVALVAIVFANIGSTAGEATVKNSYARHVPHLVSILQRVAESKRDYLLRQQLDYLCVHLPSALMEEHRLADLVIELEDQMQVKESTQTVDRQ